MKAKLGLALLAVVAVATLAGCSPIVTLTPAAQDATSPKCASVIATLELDVPTVSGLSPRTTDTQGTAAWGTPADILLRCGVPVPDPESTIPCVTVNGIDWLRKADAHNVFVFTTFGRTPAVAVTVNSADVKADGNQALTDVAIAVATIPSQHRCVAPQAVLQDGEPVNTAPTQTPTPTATPTTKP